MWCCVIWQTFMAFQWTNFLHFHCTLCGSTVLPCSSQKLPFAGESCIFIIICMWHLFFQTTAVKLSFVLQQIPPYFGHLFGGGRLCGIPFLLDLTVLQQLIFFSVTLPNRLDKEKLLDVCVHPRMRIHAHIHTKSVCPCPFILYVQCVTVMCVCHTCGMTNLNRETVFYKVRVANVAMQRSGKHISAAVSRHATIRTAWEVFCAVGANKQYNWVFCTVSVEVI
jgi:hypothetical protein